MRACSLENGTQTTGRKRCGRFAQVELQTSVMPNLHAARLGLYSGVLSPRDVESRNEMGDVMCAHQSLGLHNAEGPGVRNEIRGSDPASENPSPPRPIGREETKETEGLKAKE